MWLRSQVCLAFWLHCEKEVLKSFFGFPLCISLLLYLYAVFNLSLSHSPFPSTSLFLLSIRVLPNSARWLLVNNRKEEALILLRKAATMNGRALPTTVQVWFRDYLSHSRSLFEGLLQLHITGTHKKTSKKSLAPLTSLWQQAITPRGSKPKGLPLYPVCDRLKLAHCQGNSGITWALWTTCLQRSTVRCNVISKNKLCKQNICLICYGCLL